MLFPLCICAVELPVFTTMKQALEVKGPKCQILYQPNPIAELNSKIMNPKNHRPSHRVLHINPHQP
jgi:hypothetical protein